jgi:hypothetical protein
MAKAIAVVLMVLGLAVAMPADAAPVEPGAAAVPAVCREAHAARMGVHERRIERLRAEAGANEAALQRTRDPSEIARRLSKRAEFRRRLARLEADRVFVERRSLALLSICRREAARDGAVEPSRRRCIHHAATSRQGCRPR